MSTLHIACLIALCCLAAGCAWGAPRAHHEPVVTEAERTAARNWYEAEMQRRGAVILEGETTDKADGARGVRGLQTLPEDTEAPRFY